MERWYTGPSGPNTFLTPANEVWGKVMFSEVFVCPQKGLGFSACITGHMTGGLHPGGFASMEGVCIQRVCIGGSADSRPRDTWDTMGYGQQAGSTQCFPVRNSIAIGSPFGIFCHFCAKGTSRYILGPIFVIFKLCPTITLCWFNGQTYCHR